MYMFPSSPVGTSVHPLREPGKNERKLHALRDPSHPAYRKTEIMGDVSPAVIKASHLKRINANQLVRSAASCARPCMSRAASSFPFPENPEAACMTIYPSLSIGWLPHHLALVRRIVLQSVVSPRSPLLPPLTAARASSL